MTEIATPVIPENEEGSEISEPSFTAMVTPETPKERPSNTLGITARPEDIYRLMKIHALPASKRGTLLKEFVFHLSKDGLLSIHLAAGATLFECCMLKSSFFNDIWGEGNIAFDWEKSSFRVKELSEFKAASIHYNRESQTTVFYAGKDDVMPIHALDPAEVAESQLDFDQITIDPETFLPVLSDSSIQYDKYIKCEPTDLKRITSRGQSLKRDTFKVTIDSKGVYVGEDEEKTTTFEDKDFFKRVRHTDASLPSIPISVELSELFYHVVENLETTTKISFADSGLPVFFSQEIHNKDGETVGMMGYMLPPVEEED